MRPTLTIAMLYSSMLLSSAALGQSGGSADCTGLGGPLLSLKAVAVNGVSVTPMNTIRAMPGDVIDANIFISCWAGSVGEINAYQAMVFTIEGATSGTRGMILPRGWDAPLFGDSCPCEDPRFPNCYSERFCVGPQFNPGLGAYVDLQRPDHLLAGLSPVGWVNLEWYGPFLFGGTAAGPNGAIDVGQLGYAGTLSLVVQEDACGPFKFDFLLEVDPVWGGCDVSFLCDNESHPGPPLNRCVCPVPEPLTIRVCADDGLFCNGGTICAPDLGCQITPPPNCDDGIDCTIDWCNEYLNGCDHTPNHSPCDDGDFCTRDECTPNGCVHFDDQCGDIPTASHWGLIVLGLSLLIAAKLRLQPRRA